MAAPLHLTDATFRQEVLEAETPVLVDFWAEWCPPCKMIAPIVEEFASEYEGRLKVTKVDTDACPMVAGEYQVMSIPTLMVFRGGQPVGTFVGYQPKAALRAKLDALLLQPAR
ncbi:MAG TPA: thioredoxin [Candidatus Acidoferrales bacterium]|nr:thioredoxin [Candidatus Acidoferrales bacterium]